MVWPTSFFRAFSRRAMKSSQPGMSRKARLDNGLPFKSRCVSDASCRSVVGRPAALNRLRSSDSWRSAGARAARPRSRPSHLLPSKSASTSAGKEPSGSSSTNPQSEQSTTRSLASPLSAAGPRPPSGLRASRSSSRFGHDRRHSSRAAAASRLPDASSFLRAAAAKAGSAASRLRATLHVWSLGNEKSSGSASSLFAERSRVLNLEPGPPSLCATIFGTFSSLCSVRLRMPSLDAVSTFCLTTEEPVLFLGGPATPAIFARSLPILRYFLGSCGRWCVNLDRNSWS
mmetsp:Transcript_1873/g.5656  ORF Transcript_1873/g.5656 Transcript_1873/m.5656 type:complete len:287 (-) Transcript_1873:92-952(-)